MVTLQESDLCDFSLKADDEDLHSIFDEECLIASNQLFISLAIFRIDSVDEGSKGLNIGANSDRRSAIRKIRR